MRGCSGLSGWKEGRAAFVIFSSSWSPSAFPYSTVCCLINYVYSLFVFLAPPPQEFKVLEGRDLVHIDHLSNSSVGINVQRAQALREHGTQHSPEPDILSHWASAFRWLDIGSLSPTFNVVYEFMQWAEVPSLAWGPNVLQCATNVSTITEGSHALLSGMDSKTLDLQESVQTMEVPSSSQGRVNK